MALSLDALRPAEPPDARQRRAWPRLPPERRWPCRCSRCRTIPGNAGAASRLRQRARRGSRGLFVFAGALGLTAWGALRDVQGRVGLRTSRRCSGRWSACSRSTSRGSRWPSPAPSSASSRCLRAATAAPPRRHSSAPRTAVVMPVYNEATARVFASLAGDDRGDRAHGPRRALRLFHPVRLHAARRLGGRGARLLRAARARWAAACAIYYRHRKRNIGRKAGNIEDFVTRWGGAYEHMLVLDADSLMTGDLHRRASPPRWRPIRTPASSRRCR